EIAAGLDAAGITVVCRGPAADGAGRGIRAGRLVILGDTGESVAYGQVGGIVYVEGNAGHRAGLNQQGGTLLIRGRVGRLAGERQNGGWLFAFDDRIGPNPGRGRRGGRLVRLLSQDPKATSLDPSAIEAYRKTLADLATWIDLGVDVPETSG
ncbi:GltB/FmdC/FwdC-like GXGXG domain-containing protein, partial [Singulisphaera rosea]